MAETMVAWTLRRLGVDDETAEEMRAMASLDHFRSQLEERARGWTEQLLAQGREEGLELGLAAQRASLRRQAAMRFGPAAGRLEPFLDRLDSATKLAAISEWLMVDTIDELAAKVEAAAANERSH